MPDPDLNSIAEQLQTLTKQVSDLQAGQRFLAGDLNRCFEQLKKTSGIVDMKTAFGVDDTDNVVFPNVFLIGKEVKSKKSSELIDYTESPFKTTHAGVISGDVIFMIATVQGFIRSDVDFLQDPKSGKTVDNVESKTEESGPLVARGRIIRTSSEGFDVFGFDDPDSLAGVVTFSRRADTAEDTTDGGTLMIAATADAPGTYDCRVQWTLRNPGEGTLNLQHMMSLVFRPGT